jgi:hypothetical protein
LRIVPAGIEDVLAGDEALLRQRVYAHSRSWYLPVSGVERSALQAVLLHLDRDQVEVLATSNVTIVPPHQLSSPGPLWFATLAPTAERKPLVEEALVRALAGQPVTLPTGTTVAQTGQVIESTEQPYATNGSESFPRRTLVAGAERGGLPLPPALGAWSGTVRFGGAFVATSHRPESEQGDAS